MSIVTTQTPWTAVNRIVQMPQGLAVPPNVSLTARESQVLTLIARGYSNKEIAAELYLSINSIKTYIRGAYRSIGVERRTQAVLWAIYYAPYLNGLFTVEGVRPDLTVGASMSR